MAANTPSAAQQFAKLPSSRKILILAVMLVMIGVGYYMLLHQPLTEEIQGAQAMRGQLQTQLDAAKGLQRQFLQLREEVEARKVLDQQNMRVLPAQAEIAGMLGELNRIAELSGLNIESIEPVAESGAQFYYRIPVNLTLTGRYHQLAKFFYNISRLQRAINMENIRLQDPKVKGEDVVLKVNVLATTFRRKDA
jgi:type IV pilus assembly protein PilO